MHWWLQTPKKIYIYIHTHTFLLWVKEVRIAECPFYHALKNNILKAKVLFAHIYTRKQ